MAWASDLKVLYRLLAAPIRGDTHAERLESFYGAQAEHYDGFRKRLLQGREALWNQLPAHAGDVWVDMGGGTGSNLEFVGPKLAELQKVYVVDLSRSLLDMARKRRDERGWTNVEPVEADATRFTPVEGQVNAVTFSYSLTMIPDWYAAVDHAFDLLKPGGVLGVVDFYVSRKYPAPSHRRHGHFLRHFWPAWFGCDNVYPSPDHVPYLLRKFEALSFSEHASRIPYLPWPRAPYYLFVGRKPL